MNKTRYLFIVVIIVAVGTWAGIKLISDNLEPGQELIYFVPKTMDSRIEFWQVMNQGIASAAKEFNAEVRVLGTDTETDIEGQIRLLEQAIAAKPSAIVLAATDYNRLIPVSQKILKSGIKLITVDSGLNGGISASFIATDNFAAGQKAVASIQKWIAADASIAIISIVKGSATALERESGVRDSLKAYKDVEVLETYYSETSEAKAYDIVKTLIQENSKLKVIFGLNEPATVGAAKAIKDLGVESRVKLAGFDSSMDEIALLEDGYIQATVVQNPFNMGYLAIQTALQVSDGKKVNNRIDTGSVVITKENMFTKENQKLLVPFAEK
ncbi:substrate-binding domain-containing protein [Paenibacillus psychroresistens]|uniref:substrate-binding domain-containing protein n=1 Tax=Paenibacillus psychroresistens TaxID=1778678 RepID=UPI001D03F113|nr:substrate-binding domain-containing protein [Paenibacillus psychroresistens]